MIPLLRSEFGPTRREALRVGFLGLGGLTLADLFRLRANAASDAARTNTAVILLWIHGGPSHLETYDLKPDAPSEIRGPFKPIRSAAPGLDVCELLPEHAKIADKFTLLRSVAHDEADHLVGTRRFLTGYRDLLAGSDSYPYYPALESGVSRMRGVIRDGMPVSISVGGAGSDTWRGPGYWGPKYKVPLVDVGRGLRDTDRPRDPARFDDRRALLEQFDTARAELDASGAMAAMDDFRKQAYDVMLGGKARAAFDLGKESPKTREKYGEGWGQELLLARRLVEAGVSFVNVNVPGRPPNSKSNCGNWDDHAVNCDLPTAMRERLPYYDRGVAALIGDVYDRGLDDRVLIVACGEFGRTPRPDKPANGRMGRDHWPGAMSILVSGGGRKRGDVIGATDSIGGESKTRRYDPHDFLATIYRYLGIDPATETLDLTGRPLPLTRGTVIEGLL
ncbi:DUF1501 domain-containing protein [Gemmata sp.]|uniref:DUF1501 domain-containing protein n=1 Tax=Gemmata sp. TaxID=1914242 RepID=UPI003F6FF2ED